MNKKFYALAEEKRQAMINAGFHVFSQNSYKKSPMQEIADRAGISKSLLFHYFKTKKSCTCFFGIRLPKSPWMPLPDTAAMNPLTSLK